MDINAYTVHKTVAKPFQLLWEYVIIFQFYAI